MKKNKIRNREMYRIVILFSLILFSCYSSINSTVSEKLTDKEIISLLDTLTNANSII